MIFKKISLLLIYSIIAVPFSENYTQDSLVVRAILDANGLDSISVEEATLQQNNRIYCLGLSGPDVDTILPIIGKLSALKTFGISHSSVKSLPEEICKCTLLVNLNMDYNQLIYLPDSIGNLKKLTKLSVQENQLASLPPSIGSLTSLELIWCQGNNLTTLPAELGHIKSPLRRADFPWNKIKSIPDDIVNIEMEQGPIGFNLCDNDSIVFTEKQQKWTGVKDYKEYNKRYCHISIDHGNENNLQHSFHAYYSPKRIHITVPYDSHIILDIFDCKGKLLENILGTYKKAGTYSIPWNGYSGKSGLYLVRIKSNSAYITKRIIAVK